MAGTIYYGPTKEECEAKYGPECQRCGFRGWYEDGHGDRYCEEPGCPHAIRRRKQDQDDERFKKLREERK